MLTEMVAPAFEICAFGIPLQMMVGFKGLGIIYGYVLFGLGFIRFCMPDYKSLKDAEKHLEGRYRFVHSRIKTHAESIAFFGGDEVELELVQSRAADLWKLKRKKAFKDLLFNIPSNFIMGGGEGKARGQQGKGLRENVVFYMQYVFTLSNLKGFEEAESGALMASGNVFISQALNKTLAAFSTLVDFSEQVASLSALITRVSDYIMVLDDLSVNGAHSTKGVSVARDTEAVSLEKVDIVTPTGSCIASNLDLEITPCTPLMVTGANASGKSSLFRVMGGLWKVPPGGVIRMPQATESAHAASYRPPIETLFLVPQRVYSVFGSLADQVTYPIRVASDERTPEIEKKMMHCLSLVGIAFLVERENGWDTVYKWEDTLSLGEQQRMGMARLFFHRPKYGVLDECTSAVSVDVEEKLYEAANEMGIACISISQRLALEAFHTQELRLGADNANGWEVRQIPK
jgi:ABC-type uncharacterized transport system fused permease/ATPase subunit